MNPIYSTIYFCLEIDSDTTDPSSRLRLSSGDTMSPGVLYAATQETDHVTCPRCRELMQP